MGVSKHGGGRKPQVSGRDCPIDPVDEMLRNYLARTAQTAVADEGPGEPDGETGEPHDSCPTSAYRRKVRKRYQAAIFRSYWLDLDGHLKRSPVKEYRDILGSIGLHRSNVNKALVTGETDPYNFFISLVASRTELHKGSQHSDGDCCPFPSTAEMLSAAARRLIEFSRREIIGATDEHSLSAAEFACLTLLATREPEVGLLFRPKRSEADTGTVERLVAVLAKAIADDFPDYTVTAQGLAAVWRRWSASYAVFHRGIPFKWRFLRAAA